MFEVETQLELAAGLGYFRDEELPALLSKCETITRMIHGLLKTMREASKPTTSAP